MIVVLSLFHLQHFLFRVSFHTFVCEKQNAAVMPQGAAEVHMLYRQHVCSLLKVGLFSSSISIKARKTDSRTDKKEKQTEGQT